MATAARATADTAPRARTRRVEEDVLLTAVLCLLAYGAVMVYSASSANTVLQGQGDGTGFLMKYVMYGTIGLVLMSFVARRPLKQVLDFTGPVLALAIGCLLMGWGWVWLVSRMSGRAIPLLPALALHEQFLAIAN